MYINAEFSKECLNIITKDYSLSQQTVILEF